MTETSSGLPGNSSGIFGNLRIFSETVRKRPCDLRTSFRESLEIFGRWSEIFGKSSKTLSLGCRYNNKNIAR